MSPKEETENRIQDILVRLGRTPGAEATPRPKSVPLLAALKNVGTRHVYADTADVAELRRAVDQGEGAVAAEVDGNTANQPLVKKVVERYLERDPFANAARELREVDPDLARGELVPALYTMLLGRIGNDVAREFASGREWEASLQIHMSQSLDPERTRAAGRLIRKMAPFAFVKVPFRPDAPHCFLATRDLEREGIPVNFTSTFSARQVVAAALLGNATRTNVFMGRLNSLLDAELVGEQACLEAQRALLRLRRVAGVKTELIVASMRDGRNFVDTAGCDVYTAPVPALVEFLTGLDLDPARLESRLEESYEGKLEVGEKARSVLGDDGVARVWNVEEEFVEFLDDLRRSDEYETMSDGDELHRRFEEAGFADFFHAPSREEEEQIRADKYPDLDAGLTKRLALDTHFSLRANADFEANQAEIDGKIRESAGL